VADLPALLDVVRRRGLTRSDTPLELASGELSQDFIDGKVALARGRDLRNACELVVAIAAEAGISFDAAGGMTMGADHLSHGIALVADVEWFSVRKQPKGRGTDRWVEGAPLGPGVRVLLLEDVVTTGGSMITALDQVAATGAEVVLAVTVVDRGEAASAAFAARGVPYRSLLTYRDLGIVPVGGGAPAPTA
jgi:orotate phosphoribosyltransferase